MPTVPGWCPVSVRENVDILVKRYSWQLYGWVESWSKMFQLRVLPAEYSEGHYESLFCCVPFLYYTAGDTRFLSIFNATIVA